MKNMGINLLAVAEEVELILANLDRRAAVLRSWLLERKLSRVDVPGATYLGDQDAVAVGNTHRHTLSILIQGSGADSQNLGLVEVFHARFGEKDATGGLGLCLDSLDQNTVQERDKRLDGSDSSGLGVISVSYASIKVG